MSKELEIAAMLASGKPYNEIAKRLKVSAKTIAKVSRLIDSGAIVVDGRGGTDFAKRAEGRDASEIIQSANGLMRLLGCSDPKMAIDQACDLIAKMNPYVLHYNVKTPAELVTYLENQIRQLDEKLKVCESEDMYQRARKLEIDDQSIALYRRAEERGYPGTIGEFISDLVDEWLRDNHLKFDQGTTYGPDGRLRTEYILRRRER